MSEPTSCKSPNPCQNRSGTRIRFLVWLQAAGFVGLAGVLYWGFTRLGLLEVVLAAQRRVAQMGSWAVLVYPLLYGSCNVLLLPAGVIAIGSGLFFGLWWGFAVNLTGNVLGAAVAFALSRSLGRERLERRFFKHPKWAALDEAIGREGWKIIFLSQVHPLFPSSLLNYLYGITRIRFGTCMLWVALGQAPGLFLYSYLGTLAQLGIRVLHGENHPRIDEYVRWIGGLVLTLVLTFVLARMALRLLAEAGQKKV